jgi:hypothetical protein
MDGVEFPPDPRQSNTPTRTARHRRFLLAMLCLPSLSPAPCASLHPTAKITAKVSIRLYSSGPAGPHDGWPFWLLRPTPAHLSDKKGGS